MELATPQECGETGTVTPARGVQSAAAVLWKATQLWESKCSVSIPFNLMTSASGNLCRGEHLQCGRSLCTQAFTDFCSLMHSTTFIGYKLRIQCCGWSRFQRGVRHGPVFREWREEGGWP